MNNKYLIQVAPLVRLPILKTQFFSYLHGKPIGTGSLVRISFYRRNIEGIVVSSKKDFPRRGGLRLKNISSIVAENLLAAWQIDFARKLSDYYLSPLGIFLNSMVPKGISNIKNKKEESKKKVEAKTSLKSESKKVLLIGPADKRLELSLTLAAECLKKRKQCLILVPEVYHSYETREEFQKKFPDEEVALFHGKVARGKFFKLWKKIKTGEIKIIIATKLGVFLPYAALGLVIVEEEQDISHKQRDMNPRYNAVWAAQFLSKLHSAKMYLGSSSPSAEAFWKTETKEWQRLLLGAKKKFHAEIEIKITGLSEEKRNSDFPISKELYREISQALVKKEKILLITKRRGYSTFSVCRNCKNILKCPECGRALPYFEESSRYKCLHCSYSLDLFTACQKCGSHQFSHLGIGTQMVEQKLKRLFPSAKVARLDIDSVRTPKKYARLSRKIRSGQIDIVVGTQIVLNPGGFWGFDLVSVVSAHDFFSFPDFNSAELVLSSLVQARNIAGKNGKLIIQTFSPREPIFEFLESGKQLDFFEKELAFRKRLFFPPFSKMMKLSYKNESRKKTEKETRTVFDLLKATGNNEVEVLDPYEPIALKKRGFFCRDILIKASPEKSFRELPLRAVIGGLKKGWTIDVDPINTV